MAWSPSVLVDFAKFTACDARVGLPHVWGARLAYHRSGTCNPETDCQEGRAFSGLHKQELPICLQSRLTYCSVCHFAVCPPEPGTSHSSKSVVGPRATSECQGHQGAHCRGRHTGFSGLLRWRRGDEVAALEVPEPLASSIILWPRSSMSTLGWAKHIVGDAGLRAQMSQAGPGALYRRARYSSRGASCGHSHRTCRSCLGQPDLEASQLLLTQCLGRGTLFITMAQI